MSTRAGRSRRATRRIGLAGLLLVAAATWACRDTLLEGWSRIQLRHSIGTSAYRAAAKLTRGSRASSLLVRDWALETASRLALEPIPAGDPGRAHMRGEILGLLAQIHVWRGEVPKAEALSAPVRFQWRKMTPTIGASRHARTDRRAERKLVAEVAASGDVLGALRLAGVADERSSRFDELGDVLEGLRESVGTSRVLADTASRLDPCGEDGWAVHAMAILQARSGDHEGAFRTALRSARLTHAGREGPPHVMEILAAAGEEEKALGLADLYRDTWDRALVLARAARAFAEGGSAGTARRILDAALRLIEELPDEEYPSEDPKAVPLTAGARAWWQLGDVLQSRKCFRRAALLTGSKNGHLVVKSHAQAGDPEGAHETAAALAAHGRYPGFRHVATAEARLGRFERALSIAEKIQEPDIFALIGAEQRDHGLPADADGSFRRAFVLAAGIPAHVGGTPSRISAYRTCAFEEGRSGSSARTIDATLAEPVPLLRAALILGMAEGIEERLATK